MSKKLKIVNGQNADVKPVKTTLEQVWGSDGSSKFGTLDQSEYENKIKKLNKIDLFREATKHGIMPTDNRLQLEKKLIKAFVNHRRDFAPRDNYAPGKQLSDEAKRILSEGR